VIPGRKLAIVGGPRTGKTTLAARLGEERSCPVLGTDALIGTHGWSDASEEASTWFDRPGSWVVEGVATVRALRKWLRRHDDGAPVDTVVICDVPRKQEARHVPMAKGVATVWAEIAPELERRGVAVVRQ